MSELAGHALECLRKDDEFALYRGRQPGYPFPVLVLAPAAERPAARSLERIEHEYSLAGELAAEWAAQPLALTRRGARTTLVLKDVGGEPLERLLGKPMELRQFLRIAIGISSALARAHQQGLVHKDIKPAHVLVDAASGRAWLTGFGIASRLARQYQAPGPPEAIAGTLAYMAPEQTGRMNRSIDAHSDLYSLGVTLYQMLTGELPFSAADPLEWVHCHVARQPTPPADRAAVPGPLSAIVMKLLAKNAEERYHGAPGLESDLRRCLAQWEAQSRIDPFPLGAHDASDRFTIPEKLYGREREIDALLAAFDRVVAEGTPGLVLVSGYSGIGKSSLVNELHKVLVRPRGLFASGKFDQYQRDIPYATLAQACQTLVRQVLARDEAEVARWRRAVGDAVGSNGQLIVNLIPEVEFLLGQQPPVAGLPPQEERRRFQMVLQRFVGAFAGPEHPLVLFLDDLQWLDAATLELLEHLLTGRDVRHVLLVGAYRDNEVGAAHPLMRTLVAMRESAADVREIVLAPLGLADLGRLVADALRCGQDAARPLALLVHEKTGGNPFFAIQFLTALAEEGLFALDANAGAWTWDLERIRAKGYTDNVVELMADKLKRLSAATQEAVQQLACLGNVAESATLALVQGQAEEAMHAALREAVDAGLVFHQERAYKFLHDRIQQAAYSSIPEGQRADVHLRIGRALLASMTADRLADHVFDVANQLHRGAARLVDGNEKAQVAAIHLRAGRKAKASAAHGSALAYFSAGMALLDEPDWGSRYELTFNLWLGRAECEFLGGNFDQAEQLVAELFRRAASKVDQEAVYQLELLLHTVKSENRQAVTSGLACLRLFGIELSAHPTWEQVQAEYEAVWQTLEGRPTETLVDLPMITDPELQAALRLLSVIGPPAYFTDFHLFCVIACRTVTIGMQHGVSDASALGFALLGFISGPVFHRYREGYRFAILACDLVEKHHFIATRPKVCHAAGTVAFWTQPIETGIDFMRAAHRTAVETGDLTFACYGAYQVVTGLLLRNDPLDKVWREAEAAFDVARDASYRGAADIIRSQQRFVATMQGRTATFSTFSDADFDQASFEEQLAGDRMLLMVCFYWILKLKARFLSGDHAEALAAADMARPLLPGATAQIQMLDYFYYAALAVAALFEKGSAAEQVAWRELLALHVEQLREWADTYPPTFGDKHALVSAEIARLEARDADAMRLYEAAIRLASENGFVQNEGVAHELAAGFHLSRGAPAAARGHLGEARSCFERWGAGAKVKQLDERIAPLREEPAWPFAVSLTHFAQLDVLSVAKASQAISGQMVLEDLVDTLMRLVLENAGAQAGHLVLVRAGRLVLAAEASVDQEGIHVRRPPAGTPAESALPASLIHYVRRSQQLVLLADAAQPSLFSSDTYFARRQPRSVLCLPILRRSELTGMLYLENNLAPHAFTSERLAVLELLASQAAISLENALLYAVVREENIERKRAEESLREREGRIRRLVDANIIGVIFWDRARGITEANDAFLRSVGYSRQDLQSGGIDWASMTPAEHRGADTQAFEELAQSGTCHPYEREFIHKDGRRVAVVIAGATFEDSSERGVSFVLDVTRRKQAETELARSAEMLRERANLLDLTHDTVFVRDMDDVIRYWNRGAEDLYGWTRAEVVGKTTHQLLQTLSHEPMAAINAQLLRTGRWEGELMHTKRDGTQVLVASRWALQRDEAGSAVAVLETNNDMTEQRLREREREEMQRRLLQAAKMEAIGRVAGGIAHDFNSVLSGILAFGETLVEQTSAATPLRRYAQHVVTAANRGRALVEQILVYSRSQRGKRMPVDLAGVVGEALELLGAALPARIRLEVSVTGTPLVVTGDPTQLHQVTTNLCSNAIQAMDTGGAVRVALVVEEVAAERALSHGSLRPGRHACLSVGDQGCGMDEATLSRIFEPFFTTKAIGHGTGLGLSIVYAIVAEASGAIDVQSTVGQGSTFAVYLPLAS